MGPFYEIRRYLQMDSKRDYYRIKDFYKSKELEKAAYAFKWKSDDIPIPRNIEVILTLGGSIGWDFTHEKWVMGNFTGQVDDLNEFVEYVGMTLATNKETYHLKNNDEVIVCGNNALYLPDEPLYDWYAGFSEDIDISMYFQLINSRNIPALMADSDAKAKQIQKAFEKIQAGVPVVITTDIFDSTELIDLTDKSLIEKMQYLSSFYGETDKRFANLRGIDVNTLDKRAQVTSSELDQFSDVTSNNFIAMYEARLEFCEKMKERGINIEVVRNPIYADEPKKEEIESEEAQEEARESEENLQNNEENIQEVEKTEEKEDENI